MSSCSLTFGKLIVAGEHFIVHGSKALAMPAISPFCCKAQLEPLANDQVAIHSQGHSSVHESESLHPDQQTGLLQSFQLNQPWSNHYWLLYLLNVYFDRLGICPNQGLTLTLESGIPVGGGMGSSAAVASAVIKACGYYCQQNHKKTLDDAMAYAMLMHSETIQHGQASGLDAWVCWHNQKVQVHKSHSENLIFTPMSSPLPPCAVIYTGKPQSSTKACVAQVTPYIALHQSEYDKSISALMESLELKSEKIFHKSIQTMHALLCALGVVPMPVATFIKSIEFIGGAAKISGAGSVEGAYGGIVLVWGVAVDRLKLLCQMYHYQFLFQQKEIP